MERSPDSLQSMDALQSQPEASIANIHKHPAPRGTAAYPRRRANKACQVCRARRTKCDNKKPSCSFCEKIGAKCIVAPTDLSSFDPASLLILERLEELKQCLVSQKHASSPNASSSLGENSAQLHEAEPMNRSIGFMNFENVLSWPVFQRRFEDHLNIKSRLSRSEAEIGRRYSQPLDATSSINLEIGSCNRLLEEFLQNVHNKNPVLNEAEIHGQMEEVCRNGLRWDAQSCLILLICALGLTSSSFHDSHQRSSIEARQSRPFEQAEAYFNAAQMRLGILLGQAGVLETQCLFFSGVYLMTMQKPLAAWRLFVQAVASCQCFIFANRILSEDSEATTAKESLYWTCLKSEFELRLELSFNDSGVSDLSYPSFYPSPPMEMCRDEGRSWYFYLAEIALKRLINDVMRHQFIPQLMPRLFETTAIFEEQLAEWMQSLPPMLSLETPLEEDDILKFILRGHRSKCQEAIYWPFLVNNVGHSHRDQVTDRYVSRCLQNCVNRINQSEQGFFHRHHGTWLMLRACSRTALQLLAAYRCGQISDLLPLGWKDAVEKVIGMLVFWSDESCDMRECLSILQVLMNEVVN